MYHRQGEGHPICPVMLQDARLATEFADEMLQKGIYVIGFSFPVVPKGMLSTFIDKGGAMSGEVGWGLDLFIPFPAPVKPSYHDRGFAMQSLGVQ